MAVSMSFTFLSLLLLSSSITLSFSIRSNVKFWCSRTPNPEQCEYYMDDQKSNNLHIKQKSEFWKTAVKFALEEAIGLQNYAMKLGKKIQNEGEKAAWTDCCELFENTILMLNQTMSNYGTKNTNSETQTWLSAALTNMDTCRTGYMELGISFHLLSFMSNTVSKLISNALAINLEAGFATSVPLVYNNEFPTWFSEHEKMLLLAPTPSPSADHCDFDIVVAQDGSGDFATINEAIDDVKNWKRSGRLVIYVREGIYYEYIHIGSKLKDVTLVGDGIGKTIVSGDKHVGGGNTNTTTYRSATFAISAERFIARDMTFRNTAGAYNGQAVALRSNSDCSVFYKCSFEGHQDTLYVHNNRQFYRECEIYGTVDFIFGNAETIFQNCTIYGRIPKGNTITITAQKKENMSQNTGIVIQSSRILASDELKKVVSPVIRTYLGRPWGKYSTTVIINTYLDEFIDPAGWSKWNENTDTDAVYYGEYNNSGPGSSTVNRVKWGGYHNITSSSEALVFTVGRFLLGDDWLPSTNVPYTSGL